MTTDQDVQPPKPPEAQLPTLGTVSTFSNRWWQHWRLTWRGGWTITTRSLTDPRNVEEIAFCRRAAEAAQRFQRARRVDCGPDKVVEVARAAIGGWVLVDRAPWLRFTSVCETDSNKEIVWGPNGASIGLTWPERPGSWWVMVRDPAQDRDEKLAYVLPSRAREGVNRTRSQAIKTCVTLSPEAAVPSDDQWLREWPEAVRRFAAAGIGSTFNLEVRLVGPTGVPCTVPSCENEASTCVTRSGTDVGVEARLACYEHAGEAIARQHRGSGSA